jgi:hypothetical protein
MTRALTIATLSAILIAGCSARSVRIADLKDQPGKYDDRSVRVTGTVTTSWGLGLLTPVRVYRVDDGSGEITVLSNSGGSLRRGARVQVKGKVSDLALLGGESIGLHIREESRRISN